MAGLFFEPVDCLYSNASQPIDQRLSIAHRDELFDFSAEQKIQRRIHHPAELPAQTCHFIKDPLDVPY